MTEKEFLDKCIFNVIDHQSQLYNPQNARIISMITRNALELAKQRGAKFDPEPIELPKLKPMQRSTTHDYGFMILTESDICPSLEQAREIIRRCAAWKDLRVLVGCIGDDDPDSDRELRRRLLNILDGKK